MTGYFAATKKPPQGLSELVSASEPASMRVGPDLLLGEIQQPRQQDQEHEHLQAEALAGLHVRLGGPHQERCDVPGVLRHCCGRTVVIGHLAVVERLRHLDGVPGEIFVVVGAFGDGDTRRRLVFKALQDGVDVVRALFLVLGEEVDHEQTPRRSPRVRPARSGTATGNNPPPVPGARTFRPDRSDRP